MIGRIIKFLVRGCEIGILLWLAGCTRETVPQPSGHYYLDKTANFSAVGRVAVLELDNQTVSHAQVGRNLTQMIADGIGKKHLFSIRMVYRSDAIWDRLNLDRVTDPTTEDMAEIHKNLQTDAILTGTITRYRPFPQLMMGLNLKLTDLRDGRLLWAIEEIWDSTDKSMEIRMKQFYENQMRTGYQPMDWQLLVNSPNAFYKFVVYEITNTLPSTQVQ